jgi:hypothetical protein
MPRLGGVEARELLGVLAADSPGVPGGPWPTVKCRLCFGRGGVPSILAWCCGCSCGAVCACCCAAAAFCRSGADADLHIPKPQFAWSECKACIQSETLPNTAV